MAENDTHSPELDICQICNDDLDTPGSVHHVSCKICGKTFHIFCIQLRVRGLSGITDCPNCQAKVMEAFPGVQPAPPPDPHVGSAASDTIDGTLTGHYREDLARRLRAGDMTSAGRQWLSEHETDERIYYLLNYSLPWLQGWRTTPERSLMIQEFRQGRSVLDQRPYSGEIGSFHEILKRFPSKERDSFFEVLASNPDVQHIHIHPRSLVGDEPSVFLYRELTYDTYRSMLSRGKLHEERSEPDFARWAGTAVRLVLRMAERSLKLWIIEVSNVPHTPGSLHRYIQIVPATWTFDVNDNTYLGPRGSERTNILEQVHKVLDTSFNITCSRVARGLMGYLARRRAILAANDLRPDLDDIPF